MEFYNKIKEICQSNKKVALFVDMDGTIAEYDVFPKGYITNNTKDVFINVKPLRVVIDNLSKVNDIENLDIYILSLARSYIIVEEKKQWLKKYASFIREENYIILNKQAGDYDKENREVIKSKKMKEKLNNYDFVMLLDDEHKILRKTKEELEENGTVFHISSAII